MQEEHRALLANETWVLVPRPPGVNVVTGKWVFGHKLHPDGSLGIYKAHCIVCGFSERPGMDFDETFSPVVKPVTIRTVLSLAASRQWPTHLLDVKNAFIQGVIVQDSLLPAIVWLCRRIETGSRLSSFKVLVRAEAGSLCLLSVVCYFYPYPWLHKSQPLFLTPPCSCCVEVPTSHASSCTLMTLP